MPRASQPSHISQAQAARILGISRQAIFQKVEKGELSYIDFYGDKMIPLSEVKNVQKPQ
jgi:DNA-binding XRE family transcriptional regulator